MNKFKMIFIFLIINIIASCHQPKKATIIESIEISYIKGHRETDIPFRCGSIASGKPYFGKKDTILTSKKVYDEIVNLIDRLKIDSTSADCDARIDCKVNLINGDSIKLCIGDFSCIMKNGQTMMTNDSLVYLIRKHSGYYNYFDRKYLENFSEIRLFGVPKDYKCLIRKTKPNDPPLAPLKVFLD